MAGESTKQGILAFGKQTAKGTPLANPTYSIPKLGGQVADQTDLAELALTGPDLSRFGQYKQRAWGGGTVQFLAHPEALGLLIYECMGAQAITGASPPYTHTFTMADTIPNANPLTVWDMVGNKWMKFTDMWVNRLKFAGESGQYVECEAEFMGLTYADAAAPTLPALAAAEPRFKYIGSTTKAEADNATPVVMTNITAVEIEINRALEAQYGAAITPFDITPNDRAIDATLRIQYDSAQQGWDFYNWSATGQAATGGTASQLLPLGSFDIAFGRHPVLGARTLQFASNGALWQYSVQRPEASPSGGPVVLEAIGQLIRQPAGGTEMTVTLLNEVATTYDP